MSRGGFKVDEQATKLLIDSGFFQSKGSEFAYDSDYKPHLLLAGEDKSRVCLNLKARAKRCAICGEHLLPEQAEIDHIQGGTYRRCDCPHNLRTVCKPCHRARHPQVKWEGVA